MKVQIPDEILRIEEEQYAAAMASGDPALRFRAQLSKAITGPFREGLLDALAASEATPDVIAHHAAETLGHLIATVAGFTALSEHRHDVVCAIARVAHLAAHIAMNQHGAEAVLQADGTIRAPDWRELPCQGAA